MSFFIGIYAVPDINSEDYPELVHDHNITVLNGGNLIWFLHLERFSRIKYHSGFPQYLEDVARELKLVPAKDMVFVFVDHEIGRSFISKSGKIRLEAPLNPNLCETLENANLYWFGEKPEAYVLNHELAHIYSCIPFYGEFKENSLLVHSDGGASKSNFSVWIYRKKRLKLIEAHYKYKWLSSIFNANALVFKIVKAGKKDQNSVPGKFMGLEAYGNYNRDIEQWLIENNFFKDIWGSSRLFFLAVKTKFGLEISAIDNRNQLICDIAATIHEIFVREMIQIFENLQRKFNADYLYYSGGTSLNIKLNARLLAKKIFKDVFIPPCTNDSGLSLGAATALSMMKNHSVNIQTPYLNNFKIDENDRLNYSDSDLSDVAYEIENSKVVGICNAFGEAGPRALGNRSIVARVDNKNLAVKISEQIKKREWYRPVAPVMLLRNAKYFTDRESFPVISKYMLTDFEILPEKVNELKGCVHQDGTARIQIIFNREENPYIYDLLNYLEEKYSIRALINTSFNRGGEPIVHTKEDAIRAAEEMKLDGIVLNGKFKKTRATKG
jgi:carbamoyltransferase